MKMRKSVSVILQILLCAAGVLVGCGAEESSLRMRDAQSGSVIVAVYDTYGALPVMEDIENIERTYERQFTYIVREDEDGMYAILTGNCGVTLQGICELPDEVDGIPVKEIATEAFMGEFASDIILPEEIRVIGDRAFAENKKLWRVYIANTDCVIGEDAFAGCQEDFDICINNAYSDGFYIYTVQEDEDGEYVVLTGVRASLIQGNRSLPSSSSCSLPDEINGIPVKEIAAGAFSGGDAYCVKLSEQIRAIGDRAFADNKDLWGVYIPNTDCVIGEDAFAGCEEDFYICYGENTEGRENLLEEYAKANGMTALEVVDTTGQGVIVNYPEQPLVLTPDVRKFFNWENSEYAEDAQNYGFGEWYAPCGDFCTMQGELAIEASSELASSSDRYAATNLDGLSFYGGEREYTWAEGVEGSGIGESITYRDSMYWDINNVWDGLKWKEWDSDGNLTKRNKYGCIRDGYKHYVEICIVNGYAKNQKTWEENGRIKRLLMYVEDKPYAYLELEDTIYPQYFLLPPDDIKVAEGDEITFRFVIEDVYPGTTYEDTCLTGLVMEFTGRHGH